MSVLYGRRKFQVSRRFEIYHAVSIGFYPTLSWGMTDFSISNILEIWLTPGAGCIILRFMKIDDVAARLEALGNPTRLRIYRALVRAGDAGLSVGKLQTKLDLAGSTLSYHLKGLLIVGLVVQERQATTLICRANYDIMHGLVGFLVDECCVDAACAEVVKPAKVA
jgi:ArsR family transcriptional regulator, arsenate/arsenite/antimonite-responsive transcriptional repressor